jgi:flagellar M-ring protein FliF
VGFELFDKSSLPGTDFSNAVNLQRALQGELARTIGAISQVKSARVHLALPHESLYADTSPASASVVLDLGATGSLTPDQVRGMAYMVSSAVEGLQPEAVTILDTQGTMLHGAGSPGSDLLDTALYSSKQYAEALSTRLQTMLDAIFGPGKTIVRAQVDLDLDTEQSREEKVDPVTPHSTDAVSREHQTKETYAGNRGGAGGVSGVPAGIMGGGAAAGASGAGSYTNSQETREYEFSRRTTDRARRPGRIRRMSIAAVVDEAVASAGVSRVQDIVQAAAGLDLARGDTLVVRAMKLGGAEEAAKEATLAQADAAARSRRAIIEMLVSRGLPMVLALVLISLLARTAADVRRGVTRSSEAAAGSDSAGWQPPSGWPEQTGNAERISETMPSAPLSEEDTMVAELRRIARDQPELLAEELRNLISGQGE